MSETTEKTEEQMREEQEQIAEQLSEGIEAKLPVYDCLRDPADQDIIKRFAYAMTNIARAVAATDKQFGVIVHGGGLDVDYAEMEEQTNGYAVKRESGYSAIYRMPAALTM